MSGLRRTNVNAIFILALPWLAAVASAAPYSPNMRVAYPENVYWGDTHVHTWLSGDAFTLGTRLTPDDAYRFAKGEAIQATGGEAVRLRRPLDFLMVADHAENLGVLPRLAAGDDSVLNTEEAKSWARLIADLIPLVDVLNAETFAAFNLGNQSLSAAKAAWQADYAIDDRFKNSVWREVVAVAEQHNAPGAFTTFAGFEWSGRASGPMIHRNVLFADGPDKTSRVLPYSRFDSDDPEDLWAYLERYEQNVAGNVIAIPHNSNLSYGQMFALRDRQGQPITAAYARTRAKWEPIVEVTQIKGDSETHTLISPNDEFADYETWGSFKPVPTSKGETKDKSAAASKKPGAAASGKKKQAQSAKDSQKQAQSKPQDPADLARQSYARSAMQLGLDQQAKLGTNPFKFGLIGSTDSHTALATADEDNFWGKMGLNEPSRYRARSQAVFSASGYAAVWAHENTRDALFAAMKRREVYASTGPRMTVRFFGGWNYAASDATSPDLAGVGYRKGVPMGGDITRSQEGKVPSFLVGAVKDPDGANLDRVQIIKGWQDDTGALQERIYNVALSDNRTVDAKGKVQPVGNTVDVKNASYTNSIGDVQLSAVWHDLDFDPEERAFYYVRVLQIPTPRWTAYDARFYQLEDLPPEVPMITQERAYTSPIWYTPQ